MFEIEIIENAVLFLGLGIEKNRQNVRDNL